MTIHTFTYKVECPDRREGYETIRYRVEYRPEMRCYCWYKLPPPADLKAARKEH